MRGMALLVAMLMAAALVATAQEMPRVEVFGGYSYVDIGSSKQQKGFGLNGWTGQANFNANNWLGFTADFGGYYGSPSAVSVHDYSYMFGPTLSYRAKRITPFAHALFGGSHVGASMHGTSTTDNAFAMAVGGGIDLPFGRFGVRLAQVDWMRTQFFGAAQNNLRVSTGVMFRF